jgi:hypothetical protein
MSFVYQSEGVVSEEGGADTFLEHLPSDTPLYCYHRKGVMESLFPLYSVEDCFIVLKNFPSEALAEREEQLPGRSDYSLSHQILIIGHTALLTSRSSGLQFRCDRRAKR